MNSSPVLYPSRDGQVRVTELADILPGTLLRETTGSGTHPTFADNIVLRVLENGDVELARPYAYLDLTTGAVFTTVSKFAVPCHRLLGEKSIFRTVLDSYRERVTVGR